MKVLAVSANFDRCEASMLLELANRKAIELSILTEKNARYNEIFDGAYTPIQKFEDQFKSRFDIGAILRLRKILKKEQYDIIHLFSARAVSNGLIASFGLSVKRVAYRGTMGHLSWFDPSSWLSFLNPGLHKIICVSHAVEKYMNQMGVPPSRTVTIHKGHRIEWYESAHRSKEQIRSQLNIPQDVVVVSCVANIRPVKGVDVLLKGFSRIPSEKNIVLLLIGDIRDKRVEALISSSPNKDKIITTGFRKDATDLVAASDIFIMPSIAREGLAKAAIEAMSKGVATIVTNVGGLPELVQHRKSGLVIPPSDPNSIASSIIELVDNPSLRMQLAKEAPTRIKTDFNLEMTISKTLDIYSALNRIQNTTNDCPT
jgi:glycosyltransferase involved in cell wall biosynthesis